MLCEQKIKKGTLKIEGFKLDAVQITDVIDSMESWIKNNNFGNDIVISNINDLVMSNKNIEVKDAVNNSSLSVPDGFSLVILARMRGYNLKKRVYGADLMQEFLSLSEKKGYSHFFYGSTENTLEKLNFNLKNRYPKLKIVGFYSPPFKESFNDEDEIAVNIMNNARPDVIWVGLGCPKQQLWMYKHKKMLKVPVIVGVGAAFDFIAGTKRQAPNFMRDNGFEWLFRLATEPRRLWKRYLIGNSYFLKLFFRELFRKILNRNDQGNF